MAGALKLPSFAVHTVRAFRFRRRLRAQREDSPVARALLAVADDDFGPDERDVFRAIERARERLYARRDVVPWSVEGLPSVPVVPYVVGDRARMSSVKPLYGKLLYALARETRPAVCLELGSCLGISGLFLLAGLERGGGGRLITIEGSRAGSDIAAGMYESLGFDRFTAVVGDFDARLPDVLRDAGRVDLAFVDGNHQYEPTLRYDTMVRAHAPDGAVIAHDDIRWSPDMDRAWREIRARPAKRIFDVFRFGIVELGSALSVPATLPAWIGFRDRRIGA